MYGMFETYIADTAKRILIVRSSAKLFPVVLEDIHAHHPGLEIDVLTNLSDLPEVSLKSRIKNVLHTRTLNKFLYKDLKDFKEKVRGVSYDYAVVLYNSRKGSSYVNIDSYAFVSRATKVITFNIDKKICELSRGAYLLKWVHRLGAFIWVGVNACLLHVVLCMIVCGLFISQPFILYRKNKC
jgi:hypothetical protein